MNTLPPEYVNYCDGDGLKEGGLSLEPWYFRLWAPEEIEEFNRDYQVPEYAPGFLGFASSGGGEMLAFDTEGAVVMIPFIGMSSKDARPVAKCWSEFVEKMER